MKVQRGTSRPRTTRLNSRYPTARVEPSKIAAMPSTANLIDRIDERMNRLREHRARSGDDVRHELRGGDRKIAGERGIYDARRTVRGRSSNVIGRLRTHLPVAL